MTEKPNHDIFGSGGKGGGAEAENTMRSNARADIIELISEGPCVGLVRGAKGIYFEQTPLRNEAGRANYKGVTWEQRFGTPDQAHYKGSNRVETPVSVEVRVKKDDPPPIRTILDDNADRVRVVIRVPALTYRKKKGELVATDVSYEIDVRSYGGTWKLGKRVDITEQKFTTPVQFDHVIDLPPGGSPWDIRVRRITDDSTELKHQNETWWEALFVIVNGKFTYPHSATVRMEVDAEDFGQQIPTRHYHYKGLKVKVPVNYNPITRVYTGVWNGTFKTEWTNNPAWVFYDLVTNNRYGLGDFIDATKVDKWGLYEIAQYCDQGVRSGERRANGTWKLEPRYTFNGVIRDRKEAYRVLQDIVATWRGMAYWSLGQVFATIDKPADPVKLVTPANVIGGQLNYSGSGMKARHTVALVSWQNPDDFGRESIEVVIDQAALEKFGWRETEVRMEGCTSRGQAHRYGEWVLDTEQNETETVEYQASWDHADIKPGDIIAIADPAKANVRAGGRIVSYDAFTKTVVLDGSPSPGPGTWSLMVTQKNGTISTTQIASFGPTNAAGQRTITLVDALPNPPETGAMFVITGTNLEPRRYRVIAMSEEEPNVFKVTALFHDRTKYARVERDKALRPPIYFRPDRVVDPVDNLLLKQTIFRRKGTYGTKIVASWTPPKDQAIKRYRVRVSGPDGIKTYPNLLSPYFEYEPDLEYGTYFIGVQATDAEGRVSTPVRASIEVDGVSSLTEGGLTPLVLNLRHVGESATTFGGRDVRIEWDNWFPESDADDEGPSVGVGEGLAVDPVYKYNTIKVYNDVTNQLLRTQKIKRDTYTYTFEYNFKDSQAYTSKPVRTLRFEVTATDTGGTVSPTASIVLSNPVPVLATPTVTATVGNILVTCTEPDDIDFKGVKVWVSPTSGFNPAVVAPSYRGPNTSVNIPATPGTNYYVRVAGYDGFGETGLYITPEVAITVPTVSVDTDPPDVPTGLALTSNVIVATDGSVSCKIIATWNPVADTDLANYELELKEDTGSFVPFSVPGTRREVIGRPSTLYTARIRARDIAGNLSAFSSNVTHTSVGDTVAPAVPTGLATAGVFKAIWLSWNANTEKDISAYEIYASATTTAPIAGTAPTFVTSATAFVHTNLGSLVTRNYWIRAVDTSGNKSAWSAMVAGTTKKLDDAGDVATIIGPTHIVTGTLETVAATISTAWITNAHIVELSAAKLMAGTAIVNSITVNGQALGTVQSNSNDPIAKINSMVTQINPGRILVSGATTLADWRNGTDQTAIEGGKIAANTITANKLTIGMRNVAVEGVTFEANKPATNQVSWTTGTIAYVNDAGTQTTATITASQATWTTGTLFIYWVKGATTLSTTTTAATAYAANNVVLARYRGGVDLDSSGGRTIIDGSYIKTGSIDTAQIKANAIKASVIDTDAIQSIHVSANAITAGKIAADAIDATNIRAGTITVDRLIVGSMANEAADPDFEYATDTDSPGWVLEGGPGTISYPVSTIVNSGDRAARIVYINAIAANTSLQNVNRIRVRPGDLLLASCYCRVSTTFVGTGARCFIRYYDKTGASVAVSTSPIVTATTFTKTEVVGTVPAGAKFARVCIQALAQTDGTAYFDDVILTRATDGDSIMSGAISEIASSYTAAATTATVDGAVLQSANIVTDGGPVIIQASAEAQLAHNFALASPPVAYCVFGIRLEFSLNNSTWTEIKSSTLRINNTTSGQKFAAAPVTIDYRHTPTAIVGSTVYYRLVRAQGDGLTGSTTPTGGVSLSERFLLVMNIRK